MRLRALLFSFVFFAHTAHADWVSSWISSATYKGDKEIGYSLGSLSVRTRTEVLNPISISPPSLSIGGACGGLDFHAGSVAFLKPEYLLEKLKNAVAGAPTALFMLALAQLCPSCKNALETVEQIANQINQLQFDECKMRQKMVAVVANALDLQQQRVSQAHVEAKTYQTDTLQKAVHEANSSPPKKNEILSCLAPNTIEKKAFDEGKTYHQIFQDLIDDNSIATALGLSSQQDTQKTKTAFNLISPYLLDFKVNSNLLINSIGKCSSSNILYDISNGIYKKRGANGQCENVSVNVKKQCDLNNNSVRGYVLGCLESIKNKVENKQVLDQKEQEFLNLVGDKELVYNLLLKSKNQNRALYDLADVITSEFVYRAVMDALYIVEKIYYAALAQSSQGGVCYGQGDKARYADEIILSSKEALKQLGEDINMVRNQLESDYAIYIRRKQELIAYKEHIARENQILRMDLVNIFTGRTALRGSKQ